MNDDWDGFSPAYKGSYTDRELIEMTAFYVGICDGSYVEGTGLIFSRPDVQRKLVWNPLVSKLDQLMIDTETENRGIDHYSEPQEYFCLPAEVDKVAFLMRDKCVDVADMVVANLRERRNFIDNELKNAWSLLDHEYKNDPGSSLAVEFKEGFAIGFEQGFEVGVNACHSAVATRAETPATESGGWFESSPALLHDLLEALHGLVRETQHLSLGESHLKALERACAAIAKAE